MSSGTDSMFQFFCYLHTPIVVLLYLGPVHDCGCSSIHLILSCHVYQHLLHFVIYFEYVILLKEDSVVHAVGH